MFEIKTKEALLEDLLELVPDTTNKNVGSLIYTTLAAMAEKMAEVYMDMDEASNNTFADTADREHLIRRALERGLEPDPATTAQYVGHFNCEMDLEDRFEVDDYTFKLIERVESQSYKYAYKLESEQTGSELNNLAGSELEYLEGDNEEFEEGYLDDLIIPAQDEQDTESFREEYLESAKVAGFAGNVQAYIKAMNDIDGVAAAKVEGENNAVRIVFLDDTYSSPSQTLKNNVQNIIDPSTDVNNWGEAYGLPVLEDYSGMGYGLAPINHSVLCEGPTEVSIEVKVYADLEVGYVLADVEEEIEAAVYEYALELRKQWKQKSSQKVQRNRIIAKLLKIDGVSDLEAVLLNDSVVSIELDYDEIPVIDNVIIYDVNA